jgi:hypothetical protein
MNGILKRISEIIIKKKDEIKKSKNKLKTIRKLEKIIIRDTRNKQCQNTQKEVKKD